MEIKQIHDIINLHMTIIPNMKRTLAAVMLCCASMLTSAYPIVVPPNATVQEKRAATELEKYFNLLSQGTAKTVNTSMVHVGRSDEALAVFGLSAWSELKPDEILYCVAANGDLWIAGQGKRGAIYAVYELLEREYGVRFLTSECEYVPVQKPFKLPPVGTKRRYASPFITRCAAFDVIRCGGSGLKFSPDFVAKTRTNFFVNPQPEEWGGQDGIIGFCHTFDWLMPAANFEAHPEWFAMRNGTRLAGRSSQPCLSNKDMRKEMIKNARELLRKYANNCHFISVSQNDNQNYCQCPTCEAFVKEHGNQTDLLLDCVNDVADAIRDEFPEVFVKTLAYQYTRTPPKTIRPHDNVAILYCTIELKPFYCLESPQNRYMVDEVATWLTMAPKMMFWHYVTNFGKYYLPRGNWNTLAKDIRFFRNSRGIHIFEQGNHNAGGRAADLADLRAYVISRLIWNPDLDEKVLFDEFCSLYYGPGEKYVRRYLDGVSELLKRHPDAADRLNPHDTTSWMTDEELANLWQGVYEGVGVLANDAVYGPRMAVAALPITMTLLERGSLFSKDNQQKFAALRDVKPTELVEWCDKALEWAGAPALNEGMYSSQAWLMKYNNFYGGRFILPKVPQAGGRPTGIPEGAQWYAWNAETVGRLIHKGEHTISLKDDAAATDGKAVQMPSIHHEWYLQMGVLPAGNCDIYLECRCDLKPGCAAEGDAMTTGNYPSGPQEVVVKAAQLAGREYKLIHLGRGNLDGGYIYCAPVINPNVERIWIDRLILTDPRDFQGKPVKPAK